jgi:hypothetical protein
MNMNEKFGGETTAEESQAPAHYADRDVFGYEGDAQVSQLKKRNRPCFADHIRFATRHSRGL